LKPGVSVEQADADLKVIARNLELKYPISNAVASVSVTSLRDSLIEKYRPMLWLLEAAVVLILLITCANIANLLLVRTAAREKEIAMRAALGASRGRLIAQLLTESAVLAVLGGALGCLIAFYSKDAIIALCPANFPRLQEIRLDAPVLAFSALIVLGTSLVFGLGPAWRLSRSELITMSKSRGGSQPHRNLGVLVIGQVAFACVLLMAGGLLGQTFRAMQNVPLGFEPNHLLTVGIKLPGLKYHEPLDQTAFYQQLLDKVVAIPGVKAASVDSNVPFNGFRSEENFGVAGQPEPRKGEEPTAETHGVSPDYFRTMGIPILRGRAIGPDDVMGKTLAVVIDEALAKKFFLDSDPIGQQLYFWEDERRTHYTIVGIVPTVRHGEVGIAAVIPQLYYSAAQNSALQMTLLVKTQGEPAALLPSVRAVVRFLDPQLPTFAVRTMDEAVSASLGRQRLAATLVGGFSLLALFLAALGLYGVLAYSVTQRTREIGIRIALGSPRGNIFRLVLRQGMIMVGIGIVLGLTLAVGCGPLFRHFVYGVAPHDPLTIFGAAAVLTAIALLACWIPARRAIGVDPMVALRHE
jgi:putative ABC transport system permease protein